MASATCLDDNLITALQDIQKYIPPVVNTAMNKALNNYSNVLLTGANGYLGVHLIDELLKLQQVKIYCGVRGVSIDEAKNKLDENLERYGFEQHIDNPNIEILLIDLAQPQLGLSREVWENLSASLDAIYHNGAYVHHLQTYQRMAPTNVGSILEVIKLAAREKLKRIHFISTKASIVNNIATVAFEGMPMIAPIHPSVSSGYTATKWAAEWMLWKAQEEGIPIDIYRLGQITGHSESGAGNHEKNHLTRMVLGCLQMGYAPDLKSQHEMIPVDYVAKGIVGLSQLPYSKANGWNLINQNQMTHTDYFQIIQDLGYSLKIIPYNDWSQMLLSLDESNLFYPLISYYQKEREPFIRTECAETHLALERIGISIPEDYRSLQKRYFEYWKETDFASVANV